jgi:hypothetical protein
MFDDEDSQALAALREIINRAFDKRDAKEHLNWYIELCKSEAPGVARFFWVPVYGDKRGPQALQAIRADRIPVELIENVNRLVAGEVLKDYERMFWKEAWLIAKQYKLPVRRLRDIQRIFWEVNNAWLSARRRHGNVRLFEERADQNTLRERAPTAPQNVAAALADREKSLGRPNPDEETHRQLKARTGNPDWQPKVKARYEWQRIGLLFPCSKNHLAETVEQAIADGHSVRCWRTRRWIWKTWEYHRRKPAVLVDHVTVYTVMRGNEKS